MTGLIVSELINNLSKVKPLANEVLEQILEIDF